MPAEFSPEVQAPVSGRGCPEREVPRILRIPDDWLPGPIWIRKVSYGIGGRSFLWLKERWRAAELSACPTASSPDPERPGQAISVRLIDWARGAIIPELAAGELAEVVHLRESHDRVRAGRGLRPTLRAPAGGPQPTWTSHAAYVVAGSVYLMVGERWRDHEAWNSVSPCFPDSQRPGVMLTTRLIAAAGGEIIPDASRAERHCPSASPSARTSRQGGR